MALPCPCFLTCTMGQAFPSKMDCTSLAVSTNNSPSFEYFIMNNPFKETLNIYTNRKKRKEKEELKMKGKK